MVCSRQVVWHVAMQQSDAQRAKFMAEVSSFELGMFVWLDESECDRRNIRKYGCGIRGIRPVKRQLLMRGIRYSAIL